MPSPWLSSKFGPIRGDSFQEEDPAPGDDSVRPTVSPLDFIDALPNLWARGAMKAAAESSAPEIEPALNLRSDQLKSRRLVKNVEDTQRAYEDFTHSPKTQEHVAIAALNSAAGPTPHFLGPEVDDALYDVMPTVKDTVDWLDKRQRESLNASANLYGHNYRPSGPVTSLPYTHPQLDPRPMPLSSRELSLSDLLPGVTGAGATTYGLYDLLSRAQKKR